ncbi:MAG TPA: hypothetical protein DCS93_01380 [Microscillaceae bacterium]|nr:hypothetical protein [Microscillaceae bacterium]
MATYPVNCSTLLVNDITAETEVVLVDGMQVATVKYVTAAGILGSVTLSPVQPKAEFLEYTSGSQKLFIELVQFRAAFGLTAGQVFNIGSATDQSGENPQNFAKQICSWQ